MKAARSGWKHCPRCGAGIVVPPSLATRCAACGYEIYCNSVPTAGLVAVRDGSFLAIRRSREPFLGWWDVPGGFCEPGELPAVAAVRELREETGLDVDIAGFAGFYLDTYEFQGDVLPILNCYFYGHVGKGAEPRLVDEEATEVGWLPLDGHPPLAFDHQDAVVADVRRLLGL